MGNSHMVAAAVAALLLLPEYGLATNRGKPICSPVTFEVEASAQNVRFTELPDPNNETEIVRWGYRALGLYGSGEVPASSGTRTIKGAFTVKGTYCQPAASSRSKNVLELIISGATYTQAMWYGYDVAGDTYNYPAFAASRGYHTLTVDRLGIGADPQRPDPIDVLQSPIEAEILHQVINSIRSKNKNKDCGLGRSFDKITYMGHSYGSVIGSLLTQTHPSDLDAVILTAASVAGDLNAFTQIVAGSARLVQPRRFPADLPLGYLTTVNESTRTHAFYHPGGHDPAIPPRDFASQATLTPGELATFFSSVGVANDFVGKAMVVNGDKDYFVCNSAAGDCGALSLLTAQLMFPNATAHGGFAVENAGHDWTLHYTAPKAFADVHDWLDEVL